MAVKHLLRVIVSFVILFTAEGKRTPEDVPLPLICQQSIGPGQGILINQSVVVSDNGLDIDADCNITLATKRQDEIQRVLINVQGFSFGETCTNSSMEIFDYKTQESITGDLCSSKQNTSIFQSQSRVLSLVVTPGLNTSFESVFTILFTSFNMGKDGKCTEEEFQCANKLCIAKDLYCNGYNECSDSSDEPGSCGVIISDEPVPAYVYVIVGVVAVVVIALAAFVVFRVLRRRPSYGSI